MKIGFFKDAGEDKSIIGKIITRSLRFPYLVLRRVENPMSDKAPVYEIFERVQGDDEIQIGAVWERRMKATNDVFLTGLIDDPSMAEPLQIALFGSDTLQTLPSLLLARMGSYRTADAAGLALFLGLVCLALVSLADRFGRAPQ